MFWLESLLDPLSKNGLAYSDQALSPSQRRDWLEVLNEHQSQKLFKPASIGRQASLQLNSEIRSDEISWLNSENPADFQVLKELETWREFLNGTLFLSMRTTEAHFAQYPAGGHYKRHLDRHGNTSARLLTFIVYLHDSWSPGMGGELIIYDGDSQNIKQTIEPLPGRVVIFNSGEIWHEVRKSQMDRKSLTGWFRHDSNFLGSSK